MLRRLPAILSILVLLFALGCSDLETSQTDPPEPPPSIDYTFVKFDVASGNPADIAIPNDILRNPATGQVNLPLSGEPFDSVNSLYGFSTLGNIVIPFDGAVDSDSVNSASMPLVNLATGQPASVVHTVVTDPDSGNSTVVITPLVPLAPGSQHMVIITQGVLGSPSGEPVESELTTLILKGASPLVDGNGNSTRSALDDASAQALEPLRAAYQAIWAGAEQITGQDRVRIPFAFVFTTQPLFQTLKELRQRAKLESPTPTILTALEGTGAVDAFYQSLGLGAAPHGSIGAMYYGSFNAPNYISHPLQGPFNGEGAAIQEAGRQDIRFWAAIPDGAQGPVPVVIFQHGLTRSKEDMLVLANGACANGVGVIGIDAVLHGDRTGDFINNATGEIGPDGVLDPSGTNFLNIAIPRMARDNGRQTVADMYMLTHMITRGATDFNGDSVPELAPIGLTFVGQSLGGLMGTVFAATEPDVALATLNVPGGRLGSLVPNSPSISVAVNAGLAQSGIEPGTADYNLFFLVFQTVMDDADPMNYAPKMASGELADETPTTVLVQEMFNDQVVPNSATADLVRAMGIPQVNALWVYPGQEQVDAPHVGSGHFQYGEGAHGFLLDPASGPTAQGQTQAFTFLFSGLQGQPTIIDPFAGNKQYIHAFEVIPEAFGFEVNPETLVYYPAH